MNDYHKQFREALWSTAFGITFVIGLAAINKWLIHIPSFPKWR